MTDLIASLADAIVALINAKPSSPTKTEIEGVLRSALSTNVDGPDVPADWAVPGSPAHSGWLTLTIGHTRLAGHQAEQVQAFDLSGGDDQPDCKDELWMYRHQWDAMMEHCKTCGVTKHELRERSGMNGAAKP